MTMLATRPEVEFDAHTPDHMVDAFRHEDGSITYLVVDDDAEHANPRNDDGNMATLIQTNSRCIDIDTDVAGLAEARDRLTTEAMHRYVAIFRPDILHYEDHWSAGDSSGWGYVTRDAWREVMVGDPPKDATPEQLLAWADWTPSCTPQEVFDSEVESYRQWADGEVYGAIHVEVGSPIVKFWDHGAYVDGYDTVEESCWGFLGYGDRKEIAADMSASPITEVLY